MAEGKKTAPDPPAQTNRATCPGLRFSWLDLIDEPMVEEFLRDAEESGRLPAEHLRHIVAEYYYLRELGA